MPIRSVIGVVCLAITLVGCSAPPSPIFIDKSQLVQGGTLTLTSMESSVAAYQARWPISENLREKLIQADETARSEIKQLHATIAADLPGAVQRTAVALKILAATIPPGVLPPAAEAGLLVFSALAQVVAQSVPPQSVVVAPSSAPVTEIHTPIHPGAPLGFEY